MARDYKRNDWKVLDPLINEDLAQGMSLDEIATKHGIGRSALGMHQKKRRDRQAGETTQETPMSGETPVEVLDGQMRLDASDTVDEVPMSATADIVPVTTELVEHLSPAEVQTLDHYERTIAKGIKTFVEVGQALMAIRDQSLYREAYATFEDYLRQRWDLSRPYAYQLMDASVVVQNLSATADIVPVNEAQTRPLTGLAPEQQREVWQQAVETAPPSGITAKHVKETVKQIKATPNGTKAPKPFDELAISDKIKELYMDWLKHCETRPALERAQDFLNTLSDLAVGRGMLLSPGQ